MKKILFLGLVAAALASCSQDEALEVLAPEAIGFSNAFVNNATRVIDNTYNSTNLPDAFKVWGTTQGDENGAALVSIFNCIDVSKNITGVGNTYFYNAAYTQYWIAQNKYNFAALVNLADADVVTNGTNLLPSTVKFAMPNGDNTDLLYAKSNEIIAVANNNPEVNFTFDHLLSKVHFTVKNTMTTNNANVYYQYKVEDVQITNAYKTATCTVADKTWASHEGETSAVSFGNVSNATNNLDAADAVAIGNLNSNTAEATSRYARLLIPGEYTGETGELAKLNIKCTITTLLNGVAVDVDNYNHDVAVDLEAGHAYNFIISKGNPGEEIKFSVTSVNEWNTANPDVNLPTLGNNED